MIEAGVALRIDVSGVIRDVVLQVGEAVSLIGADPDGVPIELLITVLDIDSIQVRHPRCRR